MRKLTLLLLASALALYAYSLIAGADALAGHALRRSALAFAVAAIAFAWAAGPLASSPVSGTARTWPRPAGIAAAVAVALAGLSALLGADGVWRPAAWASALILLAVSVWWPGEREGYEPPAYRWTTDAAGRWVRAILTSDDTLPTNTSAAESIPSRNNLVLPLLVVLVAAAFLRLWRLGDLPALCVAAECEAALRLVNTIPSTTSLYDLLAHALYRVSADGLYSLRLAGALIGIVTLPVFYWAARPLDRSGAAALVTMLLALMPWHIWASRTSEAWISAPLLISLVIGAGLRAFASVDRRWWWAAGLAVGLLILDASAARGPSVLWALVLLALAVWRLTGTSIAARTRVDNLAVWLVAAVVMAAPVLSTATSPAAAANAVTSPAGALGAFLGGLMHKGAAYDYFVDHPLLAALPAALAVLGLGRLLRSLHRPRACLILTGTLLYALYLARGATPVASMAGPALTLLPFLLLAAVVSLDTLALTFWQTWRALAPPRYALGGALAVVLIAGGWQLLGFARSLDSAGSIANRTVDEAIGRHVAACLAAGTYATCVQGDEIAGDSGKASAEYSPVIYAPASALEHPSTRLLLGANLDAGGVRVLDITRDVPPSPLPDGPALYLTPSTDQASIDLLRQFYPNAEASVLPHAGDPAQFVVVAVDSQDLLERQGIEGLYFAGTDFGEADAVALSSRDGPLEFNWRDEPPLPGDFSVLWEGSLQVPASGVYRFSVDLPATAAGSVPAFTLQLDDRLILDSSLGLLEKEEDLAQGFYRLAMRYRTDPRSGADDQQPPPNWAVHWQPPGAQPAIIPREALYSPALPDMGLIGVYYGGDDLQGPEITTRKDLVLGAQADLPTPYSVRWQGKLAVPRAGEYLFAAASNGAVQVLIDGREVAAVLPDSTKTDGSEPDAPYAQASVYLQQGWREIDIRYAPAENQPELRILWQPPGSAPSLLPARYLRPDLGQLLPGDADLPPAPELLDPTLGDDDFALSFVSEEIRPQTVFPPTDLPPLLMEEVWFAGGICGPAAGQMQAPRGVALDAIERRAYVADTGNRRVLAYDLASGEPLTTYTDPEFEEPVDVAMGPDGELIVLDAVAYPLFRIDTATGEIARLPVDTEFYRPRGLDVDPLGHMLVADTGGARVVLLDTQGQVLAQFGGQDTSLGIGQPVDGLVNDGVMWAVTAEDGRLWRLYDQSGLTAMPRANTIDGPHLATLPDRGFFLSDPVGRGIRFHAPSGQPLLEFAYPDAFITPVGIAAAEADGMVYLAVVDSAACTVSLWRGSPVRLEP